MKTSRRSPIGMVMLILLTALVLSAPPRVGALSILLPTDRSIPPLQLIRHAQTVEIQHPVAKTTIHQTFYNPTSRVLEAMYLMPVPKGAQVTEFAMTMNGQRVRGEVLERNKARGIYEDIVRRMRDPGLIEYLDENLFQVRVFPIPAQGEQSIEIELTQVLPREGELSRYEFALGLEPGRSGMPVALREATLSIQLRAKDPLGQIYSPTHELILARGSDDRAADIKVAPESLLRVRDFVMYYTVSDKDVGVNLLGYRPDGEKPGWFLLMIQPRRNPDKSLAKDVTFVLDTSGSMASGGKMEQAKEALVQCIGTLADEDRFNLVRFSTEVEKYAEGFLPATPKERQRAETYIRELHPRGGTNIEGALKAALQSPTTSGRLHVVVFLTDGQPTVGETTPAALLNQVQAANAEGLRIFPFGVGYDVNAQLLDNIAETTRAAADYVKPAESIEQKVGVFFDKVAAPALTSCELSIAGPEVFDLFPQKLPDLFQGQPVLVFGRYRKAGKAEIRLTGRELDKTLEFKHAAEFPETEENNKFVEPLWGARKVGFLLAEIRCNGEQEELRTEVIALAQKYNIVTPYTSYLVVEDETGGPPLAGRVPRRERWEAHAPGSAWNYSAAPAAPALKHLQDQRQMTLGLGPQPTPAPSAFSSGRFAPSAAGQAAVEQSIALRDLREADTVSAAPPGRAPGRRYIDGRTFLLREGIWTDQAALETHSLPTLKIRFASDAYFELLRLRKNLGVALRLGERVIIRLDKVILEIGPDGLETLGETEKKLL